MTIPKVVFDSKVPLSSLSKPNHCPRQKVKPVCEEKVALQEQVLPPISLPHKLEIRFTFVCVSQAVLGSAEKS
jgi:hypothetical protein